MEKEIKYKDRIHQLVIDSPLGIDPGIKIAGKVPTSVSSEFITNKAQGDWAEKIVYEAIKRNNEFVAIRYGRSDDLSAGDAGFKEFYENYQEELNNIGKKPDLLIYRKSDYFNGIEESENGVRKAICAIEVRSSSFLVNKYNLFMEQRNNNAADRINEIKAEIFNDGSLSKLLESKKPALFKLIKDTDIEQYKEGVSLKFTSMSSSKDLVRLSELIKDLKDNIRILQKRDYLSITPKVEDIALVNRWISNFNVPHYYLQVFFDSAYIISFEDILKISSSSSDEGVKFSIEKDTKNQGKTTVKIDINIANLIIDEIEIPDHKSQMKELDRGRLLFFVNFDGVSGNLNESILKDMIIR